MNRGKIWPVLCGEQLVLSTPSQACESTAHADATAVNLGSMSHWVFGIETSSSSWVLIMGPLRASHPCRCNYHLLLQSTGGTEEW